MGRCAERSVVQVKGATSDIDAGTAIAIKKGISDSRLG